MAYNIARLKCNIVPFRKIRSGISYFFTITAPSHQLKNLFQQEYKTCLSKSQSFFDLTMGGVSKAKEPVIPTCFWSGSKHLWLCKDADQEHVSMTQDF